MGHNRGTTNSPLRGGPTFRGPAWPIVEEIHHCYFRHAFLNPGDATPAPTVETEIAMTTQAADRDTPREAVESNGQADSLKRQVQGLIDEACVEAGGDSERRNRDRFPIPYTFRLTP